MDKLERSLGIHSAAGSVDSPRSLEDEPSELEKAISSAAAAVESFASQLDVDELNRESRRKIKINFLENSP